MDEREQQAIARTKMIRKQAAEGDTVCAEALAISVLNHRQGGGYSWIDTQLDMEDEDDDFRPW